MKKPKKKRDNIKNTAVKSSFIIGYNQCYDLWEKYHQQFLERCGEERIREIIKQFDISADESGHNSVQEERLAQAISKRIKDE